MIKAVYLCYKTFGRKLVRYDDAQCIVRHYQDKVDFEPDIVLVCGTWEKSMLASLKSPKLFIDDTLLRGLGGFSCYKNGFLRASEVESEYKSLNRRDDKYCKLGASILDNYYRTSKKKRKGASAVIACLQIPLDGNLSEIQIDHVRYLYYKFIKNILKVVPEDINVIIREHPFIRTWSKERWKKIRKPVCKYRVLIKSLGRECRRNVLFDRNLDIRDTILRNGVLCGFTLNSTSGIYLLANGIPVVTDLYSIYGESLGLPKLTDILNGETEIGDILKKGVDDFKLMHFTGFYSENYQIGREINPSDFKDLLNDRVFLSKIKSVLPESQLL